MDNFPNQKPQVKLFTTLNSRAN